MSQPPVAPPPSLPPFAPAAIRRLEVFGAPVEAVLVPGRKQRRGRADGDRPALAPSPAPRIVAAEAFWREGGLALTPNLHPFAADHRLLWPTELRREPDGAVWTAACRWVAAARGTAMSNTIGAAASIAWAHVHLTSERLGFLAALPERPAPRELAELAGDVDLVQKDVPFCLLGIRGDDAVAVGAAIATLTALRLTAACNVCIQDGTAWVLPRRLETPTPHFPYALGAAELWGRWCYVDEAPFAAAGGEDLEQALVRAGAPPP